jgi:MFS family permease
LLIASNLVLASAGSWVGLGIGVALWGVHMGMTQGLLAAMVADTAPEDLRGTAYGFFNLLSGLALLASSVIAGVLWDTRGSAFTFYAGAGFAALTLLGMAMRPAPQRLTSPS